jgi:hypothetical protein
MIAAAEKGSVPFFLRQQTAIERAIVVLDERFRPAVTALRHIYGAGGERARRARPMVQSGSGHVN